MQVIESGTRVIRFLLDEIMTERNLSAKALADLCGVSDRTIVNYAKGKRQQPSLEVLVRIAAALGVPTSSLYEEYEREDLLRSAISQCRDAIVHLSSRPFPEPRQPQQHQDPAYSVCPEYVSSWDYDTGRSACDYANELGARCTFQRHPFDPKHPPGAPHIDLERMLRDGAFHYVPGSPLASSFAETVVAWLYGVPPCRPDLASTFPYNIDWSARRGVVSSFGRDSSSNECGIWSRDEGRVVARHVSIKNGNPQDRGEDCGLLVLCRLPVIAPKRGQHCEGLVAAGLGITGVATAACIDVLRDPKNAVELYPPKIGVPIMRAVTCKYGRSGLSTGHDNRFLDGSALLPLHGTAQPTPPSMPQSVQARKQAVTA